MEYNKYILYLLFFVALMLILLLLLSIIKGIRKIIYKKQEAATTKRLSLLDKTTFKPATIVTSYIQKDLSEIIKSYVYGIYNNNLEVLPKMFMTKEFYEKSAEEIKRNKKLGVTMVLHGYNPFGKIKIKQDNGSFYIVSRLLVVIEYYIYYERNHMTFAEPDKRKQKVRQTFIFTGTNDSGWLLSEVENEEVLEKILI